MPQYQCKVCSKEFKSHNPNPVYCSKACRFKDMHGENHPRWKGGERSKICPQCGDTFHWNGKPFANWEKQKFCSKQCADKGGIRFEGESNSRYKADARRKNRRGKQHSWSTAVFSRDGGKCQHCGSSEHLQAHHIKSFSEFPELRWEVSNGLTLCYKCHWAVHAALNENGVNSGNIRTGNAEDNPEPSFQGNLIEGVTTSGRAYRRVESNCSFCGKFVSKAASDAKGKKHLFCSKSCASKWRYANGIAFANGSNATTSAPPERDDIV